MNADTGTASVPTTEDRRRSTSVRVRILGWYVVLLGVSLIAALFLQRTFLLAQAESDAELALDQEVEELEQLVGGSNPTTGEPFGGDVSAIFDTFLSRNVPLEGEGLITFVNGDIYKVDVTGARIAVTQNAAEWAEIESSVRGVVDDPELGDIHYLAVPLLGGEQESGVFVVSVLMENRFAAVDGVIRLGAIVYGSIFLLASIAAWVAAGRILRPLTDLTETAQAISDTDLSRRIEVEGDDEIAELGRTFNSMLDRLDEGFASQRRFVDDAGHELRTPITIIRGNLEVMGDDPQEREATIDLVTDELDRMSRIVDDLLDLAKAEQPDFIQPAPMDLGEFTNDLRARAESLNEREWLVERADHVVIEADRHRLNQAMMNLIRNAAEHSPRGTPVRIGSKLDWRSRVSIWVADEGNPIPAADRDRIFDRFSRIESERRKTDGAGLGLAIVAAIAEAHGGQVEVDSPGGKGNVFTITIPSGRNTR
ncbi:MAG TPA: HAMP domain-containing sensor histidine kinase [Acidimicrobiia bacterium]|nr:HAMP domain-containing sensor histidine kinase [Acidimicrobiia bacterium]